MFETCTGCGRRILFGAVHATTGVFCCRQCQKYHDHPGFCESCNEESLPISCGALEIINGIGEKFIGKHQRCLQCGSVVTTLWYCVCFVPVFPRGRYRVIYGPTNLGIGGHSKRFMSRKLRDGSQKPLGIAENADIFLQFEGQEAGPFTASQVREACNQPEFRSKARYRVTTSSQWNPVSDL